MIVEQCEELPCKSQVNVTVFDCIIVTDDYELT